MLNLPIQDARRDKLAEKVKFEPKEEEDSDDEDFNDEGSSPIGKWHDLFRQSLSFDKLADN